MCDYVAQLHQRCRENIAGTSRETSRPRFRRPEEFTNNINRFVVQLHQPRCRRTWNRQRKLMTHRKSEIFEVGYHEFEIIYPTDIRQTFFLNNKFLEFAELS